jgi:DNA-binding winged helix-turn-helix (wHTH) protein
MNTPSSPPDEKFRFGQFEVEVRASELRKAGIKIKLYGQPFEVLVALLERPGQVVTREELRQRLWPPDVFVDVEVSLNKAVNRLREALGDNADNPRFVETLPRRGYRFIAPVKGTGWFPQPRKRLLMASALVLSVLVAGAAIFLHFRQSHSLQEGDTILLADFDNTTGEIVFDEALKQGLLEQLEQTPFFTIYPDERARLVLPYMRLPPDTRLTPAITREVCIRRGINAMVAGSIASLGNHYVISLSAVNCNTGDSIGRAQVEAESREQVLAALSKGTSKLRAKLGESLHSIQKFETPRLDYTTNSLEALEAFHIGWTQRTKSGPAAAIPFHKRAIQLDPDFALAYASLGNDYFNLGESGLAAEYTKRAFEMKGRVGPREEFYISSHYFGSVTREIEKQIEVYKLWMETFPRASIPYNNLTSLYNEVGWYEKTLTLTPDYLRFYPDDLNAYAFAGTALVGLNRYEEAKRIHEKSIELKVSIADCHEALFQIAFLRGDGTAMERYVSGCEDSFDGAYMFQVRAEAAAFSGRLHEARARYRDALEMAQRNHLAEFAADLVGSEGLVEANFGNFLQAGQQARAALAIGHGPDARYLAAVSLAVSGEIAQARVLSEKMDKDFPTDTILHSLTLPTVRATIETNRGDPSKAIELLRPAAAYELGSNVTTPTIVSFLAIYVRGQAFLQARKGTQAAMEFQKILDHRGVDLTSPLYPLAHLGLARARKLDGDTSGSKKSYEDFFALWKGADTDIPVLRKAKAEYAKLN